MDSELMYSANESDECPNKAETSLPKRDARKLAGYTKSHA